MDYGILLSPKIQVVIASYGGVGTTFLAKEISKYKITNDYNDKDGYKHLPIPPISTNKNLKIVYIIGDPILATLSLFRRNFAASQSYKLNRYKNKEFIKKGDSLCDYAADGIDKLNFEEVYQNWCSTFQYYPTLIIKYSEIHNNLLKLKEFIDLPDEFVDKFPEQKQRLSSTFQLDEPCKNNLEKLYGEFSLFLKDQPPFLIRNKQNKFRLIINMIHPVFIKALFMTLIKLLKQKIKFLFK